MVEKFSREENGYNKEEVNKFVDDVIVQTEAVINRVRNQQDEIRSLKKELEHYKKIEETLKSALLNAEKASNDIKQNAIEESKIIITDAKRNASHIINDALIRAEKIEIKADTLERNIITFKRKLKLIVEQQLAVVEDIEELDLKD
ncbi:MAG: DivIVA domain-containing protein [Firmicutes bacterium]|nr:DivIVA domain-containing protein [Bacillota bacterium]